MKTNYLLPVLFVLLFAACKEQKAHNAPANDPAPAESKAATQNNASIFNLTSAWHTQMGNEIHLPDLKGKVLVVVMIYTSCKVACPRLVADMKGIHDKVPANLNDKVQYVLVSIDPETDTPERLKAFAESKEMNGPEWTFLQGNPETVREFANVLAVKYKEISPMDFSHSNIISVFNTQGDLVHQQEGLNMDNKETVQTIIKTAQQ